VPLADSPWDFSPPPFLETSSPKLPSWRPSRPRPRWGQSPPPQQRSDGEEEEEVAGFSGQMLAGKLDNSVNNVLDFPMHLACPEEEGTAEGADAPASAPGDESISSLSELVRAMHPYCLPNLTHLASLEGELEGQADADADELTLPEGCVVLEIVGQAATTGDDLEIPVVVRQIPSGSQSVLLDESLGSSPALQLLMPTMESETEAAVPEVAPCPDEELPLSSACLLEPREIMESLTPKEPQSLPASASQGSQKVPRKGRKKKNKEQPTACVEACTRRLRSSSRGQSTVSAEVNSQAGSSQKQPQEELQREAAALQSRGKPRAWARAWAAALEKTGSENLERSAGQDSPAEEDALDLCPKLLETSQANPTLSLNDSAQADSMPVDSVEGDSPAVGNAAPGDQASSGTELVGSLPVGPNLTSPVLADKKGIEPAVAIPTSDNLSPADVLANTVAADPVPNDPAPADPVLVKCRPTDPRRAAAAAAAAAQGSRPSLQSADHPKVVSPEGKDVVGPLKVEGSTSATTQEAKPRPLSLSEYRQRRQQRQTEAEDRNSQPPVVGKWPSLPETPTELADIPCLVPSAPARKTAPQRSPIAVPETVSVGSNPVSPTPEPSASKLMVSTHSEQVSSHEMPLAVRPPPPPLPSVSPAGPIPSTVPAPLPPFPPSVPPLLPLPSGGHGVPRLPPPPLQPPGLPVSMRQMPPDPYTQYAPVPPWSCYPSVSPPGYSCLPPPPTMPIVSGTPGTYAVPPTCNVPWVPPPAPVSPYSSSCAYGSLGWGPGLQQPPFWSTVSPPPLSSVPTGRAVPPTPVEPSGDPAGPPEDVLPGPVTPSLSSGPASPAAPPVEPTKPEAQPVPVSPQPKHKVSTLVQSPQIKAPPTLSTEGVVFEESVSERLKSETQENRPKEKPISTAIKSVPVPKQSAVAKLPAVHPARLRKLSFLPTPRAQGPEDVVQAFISEIGE
jgi:peroxisome proliferator-activated receptor gamma coactivator-related protein 1